MIDNTLYIGFGYSNTIFINGLNALLNYMPAFYDNLLKILLEI